MVKTATFDSAMAADSAEIAALEGVLGGPVSSATRVGAGRNSRVYWVVGGGEEYAAKFYFGPTADGRDRLEVEFGALEFLWGQGVRCIPQPFRADPTHQLALYEFVHGQPIQPAQVGAGHVEEMLSFTRELHRVSRQPTARGLPAAAEAFFTVDGLIGNVRSRLERLRTVDPKGSAVTALLAYLQDELGPAFERFAERALAADLGELEWQYRTLSASDFGFHNALCKPDGRLTFLDFEYFGWDDPAKTVSDAELHPRMRFSKEQKQRLASGFETIFGGDPGWQMRLAVLYPLFGLKWCLIMLNEFRPEQIARRRYIGDSQDTASEIQFRQLRASREQLSRLAETEGAFPYREGQR